MTDYARIDLSPEDIRQGRYKQHLGGGAPGWEQRGQFQLLLLRWLGMTPSSTLLDFGCGPLRAGRHLMAYLEPGHYCGVDFNASFIEAGRAVVHDSGLAARRPTLGVVEDFDVAGLGRRFDLVLAFSVLNHCTPDQRLRFFPRIAAAMHGGSRLFITHAAWLKLPATPVAPLAVVRRYDTTPLPIHEHGWQPGETIFPILELALAGGSDGARG